MQAKDIKELFSIIVCKLHINTFQMRLLLTVLFCLFFAFKGYAQYAYDLFEKKHAPADLKKDIDVVRRTLEKSHPNLYQYISKVQLNEKFDSLKQAINTPLKSESFIIKLLGVLSGVGDGHIMVYPDQSKFTKAENARYAQPDQSPIFQFEYRSIGKRLFIARNLSKDSSLVAGTEILSIDHVPAADIIETVVGLLPSDGYNQTFKYFLLNAGPNISTFYRALYGVKDSLEIEVRNPKELTPAMRWVTLHTVSGEATPENDRKTSLMPPLPAMPGTDIRYFKVRTFMDQDGKDPAYADFFKDLRQHDVKTLILDLRGNIGGSTLRASQLLTFLIDTPRYFVKLPDQLIKGVLLPPLNKVRRQQIDYYKTTRLYYKPVPDVNNFKGKIYVLINGGSFSATTLVAANLLGMKNITFVGQETGGGRNGWTAGYFEQQVLPESKLTLRFGIIPFEFTQPGETKGRGVMPDVAIEYTMDDYLGKKDLELEWVLQDIVKNKTP
jgi:hypothetical protein